MNLRYLLTYIICRDVYQGSFKNNKRHGHGETKFSEGLKRHIGAYGNGKPHGYGEQYTRDGTLYFKGQWVNGEPEGQMVPFFDDSVSMVSEISDCTEWMPAEDLSDGASAESEEASTSKYESTAVYPYSQTRIGRASYPSKPSKPSSRRKKASKTKKIVSTAKSKSQKRLKKKDKKEARLATENPEKIVEVTDEDGSKSQKSADSRQRLLAIQEQMKKLEQEKQALATAIGKFHAQHYFTREYKMFERNS